MYVTKVILQIYSIALSYEILIAILDHFSPKFKCIRFFFKYVIKLSRINKKTSIDFFNDKQRMSKAIAFLLVGLVIGVWSVPHCKH